jgi:hypothetical protein
MREKMVPAEGIGIFRGIENRQLQNVENGKIAPDWNVSGTRIVRPLANFVAS